MSKTVIFLVLAIVIQTSDAKCPENFSEFNMACYYFGEFAVSSVMVAKEVCLSLNSYLLNINAELEYQHIIDMIKKQHKGFNGYWTGGVYKNGYWVWEKLDRGLTKDTFMDPDASHYHWGPNEPSSSFPLLERYAAIMTRGRQTPYHLYSERGNVNIGVGMGYICEADWVE